MNTKILLLGALITTLAGSALATDALLSPRAYDNQIIVVAADPSVTTTTITYATTRSAASPRAQAAQIKVVKGEVTDRNPALECIRNMNGTPKAVTACSQSVTMPGCAKLASAN
jgi:hypothetical protein